MNGRMPAAKDWKRASPAVRRPAIGRTSPCRGSRRADGAVVVPRSTMGGGGLRRRVGMILAAALVMGGVAALPFTAWRPIAPAVADEGGGGGNHGPGGGEHGDDGGSGDNSGEGSANSGPGGGDDHDDNEAGEDGGSGAGAAAGRGAERDGPEYIRGEVVVANLSGQ